MAYLEQIQNKYDLDDELSAIEGRRSERLGPGEKNFPNCIFRFFFYRIPY
jgi:hypothetical protein